MMSMLLLIDRLLQFLEMGKDYVTAEALVSKTICRLNTANHAYLTVLFTKHNAKVV